MPEEPPEPFDFDKCDQKTNGDPEKLKECQIKAVTTTFRICAYKALKKEDKEAFMKCREAMQASMPQPEPVDLDACKAAAGDDEREKAGCPAVAPEQFLHFGVCR